MKLSRQQGPAPVQTAVNSPVPLFPWFSMCVCLFLPRGCFPVLRVHSFNAGSHLEVYWRGQQRNGSADWNVTSMRMADRNKPKIRQYQCRKCDLVLCIFLSSLEFSCVSSLTDSFYFMIFLNFEPVLERNLTSAALYQAYHDLCFAWIQCRSQDFVLESKSPQCNSITNKDQLLLLML